MPLPPANAVEKIDATFLLVIGLSLGILLLITLVAVYFTIRYSRKRHPEAVEIPGNWRLEVIWTVIPTILVMIIFSYGWEAYRALREIPADAMEVKVTARMFSWNFTYPNGRECGDLLVPAGRPVRLDIVSQDVIHGLFIPAFRLKRDAVPGMTNQAWFLPATEGTYEIFCSAYCGPKHYGMTASVVAVAPDVFDAWLAGKTGTDSLLAAARSRQWAASPPGIRVLEKYGCLKCHSIDGRHDVGPTLKGLLGCKVQVLREGHREELTADPDYIRHAIREPKAELVVGYDALMAAYSLPDEEMSELLEYLQRLK